MMGFSGAEAAASYVNVPHGPSELVQLSEHGRGLLSNIMLCVALLGVVLFRVTYCLFSLLKLLLRWALCRVVAKCPHRFENYG